MTDKPGLISELKRRNVFKASAAYLALGWVVIQVTSLVQPMLHLPDWIGPVVLWIGVIGFPFVVMFSWVYELTPDGLKREHDVARDDSITHDTGHRLNRATFVLVLLAVAMFGVDRFVLAPKRAADAARAQSTEPKGARTAVAAAGENSIAVLPLANATGDKDQQYFSDGLSENLIVALSQFAGLKVIGRNSSFQFRDTKDDSKTIGSKLGVAHLLEGSVQRSGVTVRVTAELISSADGSTLWSQRYDRPYQDLFALQDEITTAVASALKAKLLTDTAEPAQSDRPPGGNLEAYSAYLQAKFLAERSNEKDLRAAIAQYEAATRLDPRYALAWASLSREWSGLATQHLEGAAQRDAFEKARETAATALQLEPDLAAGHWARGFLLASADFDWAGAEKEYRRAYELGQNDARAKYELARITATLGHPDDSLRLTESALAIDPLNARWRGWQAQFQTAMGNLAEARSSARTSIELQPSASALHFNLIAIEVLDGHPDAARAAAEGEPEGIWRILGMAIALQAGSDRAAADAALKLAIERYGDAGASQIAQAFAVRHEPDKVFEWLERAWSTRDPGVQGLLYDPLVLAYRDDPRFAAFCRKAGLPATTTAKLQRIPDAKGKA